MDIKEQIKKWLIRFPERLTRLRSCSDSMKKERVLMYFRTLFFDLFEHELIYAVKIYFLYLFNTFRSRMPSTPQEMISPIPTVSIK